MLVTKHLSFILISIFTLYMIFFFLFFMAINRLEIVLNYLFFALRPYREVHVTCWSYFAGFHEWKNCFSKHHVYSYPRSQCHYHWTNYSSLWTTFREGCATFFRNFDSCFREGCNRFWFLAAIISGSDFMPTIAMMARYCFNEKLPDVYSCTSNIFYLSVLRVSNFTFSFPQVKTLTICCAVPEHEAWIYYYLCQPCMDLISSHDLCVNLCKCSEVAQLSKTVWVFSLQSIKALKNIFLRFYDLFGLKNTLLCLQPLDIILSQDHNQIVAFLEYVRYDFRPQIQQCSIRIMSILRHRTTTLFFS